MTMTTKIPTTSLLGASEIGLPGASPDVWIGKADVKGYDVVSVDIIGPPDATEAILQALAHRNTTPLQFAKRFTNPDNILLSYQILGWLLEYCRLTRRFRMQCNSLTSPRLSMEFDLTLLISASRECQRPGCHNEIGLSCVSCSRCLITLWCSPTCLGRDYEPHKNLCDFGYVIRSTLGL